MSKLAYEAYPGAKNSTKCGLLASSLSKEAAVRVATWVMLSNETAVWTRIITTNSPQAMFVNGISNCNVLAAKDIDLFI